MAVIVFVFVRKIFVRFVRNLWKLELCADQCLLIVIFFSLKGILVMDSRSHLVAGNFVTCSEIVGCELF